MRRLFNIFFVLFCFATVSLFGDVYRVQARSSWGSTLYFDFDSYDIRNNSGYKKYFIKHAVKYINDENLNSDGLRTLVGHYSEALSPIVQGVVDHITTATISENVINNVYDCLHCSLTDEHRKAIKEAAKKRWTPLVTDVAQVLTTDTDFPKIDCLLEYDLNNHQNTQTEHHFCHNMARIFTLIRKYSEKHMDPYVKFMLGNAFKKEIEECHKGNYVFWHGRQWSWDFKSDMYKRLYNLTVTGNKRIGRDYVPLRFGDSEGDGFCLNYALFGNANDETSGTLSYVLRNHDYSWGKANYYTPEWMFARLNIAQRLYAKYAAEFERLEQLHKEANSNGYGSLLLISVSKDDIHHIYPAWRGSMGRSKKDIRVDGFYTYDVPAIVNALRTKPTSIQDNESDLIEFGMCLTNDYALDHQKGPRIFSFNAADQNKMNQYCQACDALFARIARDIRMGR
ncbi:MAG: hypothetical protein NTX86_00220 [Candidatus Dependentiae bacterium]|nr:hypothetical protein [Candidatus Dependentiae bacterium]